MDDALFEDLDEDEYGGFDPDEVRKEEEQIKLEDMAQQAQHGDDTPAGQRLRAIARVRQRHRGGGGGGSAAAAPAADDDDDAEFEQILAEVDAAEATRIEAEREAIVKEAEAIDAPAARPGMSSNDIDAERAAIFDEMLRIYNLLDADGDVTVRLDPGMEQELRAEFRRYNAANRRKAQALVRMARALLTIQRANKVRSVDAHNKNLENEARHVVGTILDRVRANPTYLANRDNNISNINVEELEQIYNLVRRERWRKGMRDAAVIEMWSGRDISDEAMYEFAQLPPSEQEKILEPWSKAERDHLRRVLDAWRKREHGERIEDTLKFIKRGQVYRDERRDAAWKVVDELGNTGSAEQRAARDAADEARLRGISAELPRIRAEEAAEKARLARELKKHRDTLKQIEADRQRDARLKQQREREIVERQRKEEQERRRMKREEARRLSDKLNADLEKAEADFEQGKKELLDADPNADISGLQRLRDVRVNMLLGRHERGMEAARKIEVKSPEVLDAEVRDRIKRLWKRTLLREPYEVEWQEIESHPRKIRYSEASFMLDVIKGRDGNPMSIGDQVAAAERLREERILNLVESEWQVLHQMYGTLIPPHPRMKDMTPQQKLDYTNALMKASRTYKKNEAIAKKYGYSTVRMPAELKLVYDIAEPARKAERARQEAEQRVQQARIRLGMRQREQQSMADAAADLHQAVDTSFAKTIPSATSQAAQQAAQAERDRERKARDAREQEADRRRKVAGATIRPTLAPTADRRDWKPMTNFMARDLSRGTDRPMTPAERARDARLRQEEDRLLAESMALR